jgi:hypothetical protein
MKMVHLSANLQHKQNKHKLWTYSDSYLRLVLYEQVLNISKNECVIFYEMPTNEGLNLKKLR